MGPAASAAPTLRQDARRPDGIFLSDFEQGEIGPDLFRAACNMGLEGMVSKRADRPYRAGRSKDWVKVKNHNHPAMDRVMDSFKDVACSSPSTRPNRSRPCDVLKLSPLLAKPLHRYISLQRPGGGAGFLLGPNAPSPHRAETGPNPRNHGAMLATQEDHLRRDARSAKKLAKGSLDRADHLDALSHVAWLQAIPDAGAGASKQVHQRD